MSENRANRIPPQSLESEQALLGAIMISPESLHDIIDLVSQKAYYSEKHQIIYKAMLALNTKSEPIDMLSVSNVLQEMNQLEQIGGRSYLAGLVESVPASSNVEHYGKIVQKKFILRELIGAGEFVSNLGFDESTEEVEEIMDKAEKKIFELTNAPRGQKFVSIKHSLEDVWKKFEMLQDAKDGLRGVPSGFQALDNMLAGFQPSDLIILAARPSVGKTALALDFARNAALAGTPVGIFSLEMSSDQLTQRMLSSHSKVNAWKLRTGKVSAEQDFQALALALDELSKAPIYIDDQAGNAMTKMKAAARRLKSEHGLGMIIIDYLQLMSTSKHYDSMVNQVTEISRSLKGLARELNVPVIALSQLSRAVETRGGKPRLSDLRDSGSIEQDADVVMFIHREDRTGNRVDNESDGIAEILIEKHRNGAVGKVDLFFDDTTGAFLPIDNYTPGGQGSGADGGGSGGGASDDFGGF